jgi:PHD/YefM family antitoxin component YafN of YafNO toxin-antitoxin module
MDHIMNSKEVINLFEMDKVDFDNLSDGAHYIIDNDNKPIAVLMSYKYYSYLEQLMFKLKDKILDQK